MNSLIGNFGARDMLSCERCEGPMTLTRRSPHREIGAQFEEQWFTCKACCHVTMRTVDGDGQPPEHHTGQEVESRHEGNQN